VNLNKTSLLFLNAMIASSRIEQRVIADYTKVEGIKKYFLTLVGCST